MSHRLSSDHQPMSLSMLSLNVNSCVKFVSQPKLSGFRLPNRCQECVLVGGRRRARHGRASARHWRPLECLLLRWKMMLSRALPRIRSARVTRSGCEPAVRFDFAAAPACFRRSPIAIARSHGTGGVDGALAASLSCGAISLARRHRGEDMQARNDGRRQARSTRAA
jgi:hypothetical protein